VTEIISTADHHVVGMDTELLKSVLEDAGLSPYQTKAYVALLELGTASASELAQASGVPDPRIYDVVRDLEETRYVETYEQDTLRVRAYSPDEVLSDLRTDADRFQQAAEEIEDRWERPERESKAASIVKRFETILNRSRLFIENATDQVRLSVSPEQFELLQPELRSAHDRGVPIHLALSTHPEEPDQLPERSELAGTCTEARHRQVPSPFVTLADRTKACFSSNPLASSEYGVILNDRTYEYVFRWYFLTCLWEMADPVYTDGDDPRTYLDIRRCIRKVEPLLREGSEVTVRVEGRFTDSSDEAELVGTVTDVDYEGERSHDGGLTLLELAGRATLEIDTGDRVYTVGGWGATLEEFEATCITIE